MATGQKNILLKNLQQLALSLIVVCLFMNSALAETAKYRKSEKSAVIEMRIDNKTDYKLETKDNEIYLSFNKPLAEQLSDVEKQIPEVIASKVISKNKRTVVLTANNPVNVRNFNRKNKLIIEISPKAPSFVNKGIDAKNKTVDIAYGDHDKFSRFVFDYVNKPTYKVKSDEKGTIISFLSDVNLTTGNIKKYPQIGEVLHSKNDNGGTDIVFPNKLVQSFEHKNKIVLDIEKSVDVVDVEKENIHKTEPIEVSAEKTIAKNSQLAMTQLIPQDESGKVASLSFSWNIPVNLSVFNRDKYLWIVFDHRQSLDIKELAATASVLSDELIQMPHPNATVLRLKVKDGVKASVRKEGLLWIVDLLTKDLSDNQKDMPIFTQYDSLKQPYLFIPTTTAGNIVTIIDPEIGDLISISPTSELGAGLKSSYTYPDFDLLSSNQGVAMVFKTHDIGLNRSNSGLSIKAKSRGLNISPDIETLKRHELLGKSDEKIPALVSDIPSQILNDKFLNAVNQLEQDIITAPEEQKDKAKLLLARYYLSKGLGSNAFNILKKIPEENTKNEKMQGLLGVANFLMGRYDQAIENFAYGKLPEINEAIFWRTLALAAKEPKPEYNVILLSYISLIKDYPNELKNKIAMVGAETAIKANDDMSAQNFIDVLKSTDSKRDYTDIINYLSARKMLMQGYPRNAVREFRKVGTGNSLKYSALSRKYTADLEIELNAIKPEKAIEELEKLRFVWGEKNFRKELLRDLTKLYVKNNDYYNALKSQQTLYGLSSKEEQSQIEENMISLFEDVYINNRADNLPPLKSLALYQDFEWLAPKSEHYNEIIQKLSDRLVAVDLLDRAEQLLNNQLKFNPLTPSEKGTVGTRLALIYLFKDQSYEAVEILDKTESNDIAETVALHRKIIRAKALSNMDRQEEALELLKDDYSKNAILLKSEIYWNGGMWGQAADSIKYLIEKPVPGKALTHEQISLILDWATALKKSGKETVIVRLRNKFMPYFKDTKYHSAFNILTNRLDDDKVDIKAINQVVNEIAAFSNFAKIYNNSLRNNTLSETIE